MVRRGTARAGDALFVSGTLGDAALGLALRKNPALADAWGLSAAEAEHLRQRYLRPQPRLALARRCASTHRRPWTSPTASPRTWRACARRAAARQAARRRPAPLARRRKSPGGRSFARPAYRCGRRRLRDPRRGTSSAGGNVPGRSGRRRVPVTRIGGARPAPAWSSPVATASRSSSTAAAADHPTSLPIPGHRTGSACR